MVLEILRAFRGCPFFAGIQLFTVVNRSGMYPIGGDFKLESDTLSGKFSEQRMHLLNQTH